MNSKCMPNRNPAHLLISISFHFLVLVDVFSLHLMKPNHVIRPDVSGLTESGLASSIPLFKE